jgi:hypothetical protein
MFSGLRIADCSCNTPHDTDRLVHSELPLTIEPAAQRFALHERHDVVERFAGYARIKKRKDMGVLKVRRDPDLLIKAVADLGTR